jgi:phenazine biosynthesis protein phzE
VEVEPHSGDVHLLAGPTYRGVQFHAESILTQHGHDLLRRLVLELIG